MRQSGPNRRILARAKALMLIIFIISSIAVVRLTPAGDLFTIEQLEIFLQKTGFWAPLAYMIIYTIGVCLFVPGTVLGAMGAIFFGIYWGFVCVWLGAMGGGVAAFFIGRYLGREFAASLVGDRLKKYDDAIEKNGFATVLYLRLIYFPFTPLNYGMGLTKVKFWDYFFGTGLGIITGTFIFIFFIGSLKEVWSSGNWGELFSPKVFFSIALFTVSLFIPKIINRFKKE